MNQIELKKRQMEMVSQMLGLIVLLVLGNLLGDNGIAYLAIAVEVFLLFWTFTGSRLADILGRILRGRSSKGQYKNAVKLRRNALVIEGFLGIVGSVIMFLVAEPLGESLFGLTYSVAIIRILAPVVFVRTLSSVLLGYFQGQVFQTCHREPADGRVLYPVYRGVFFAVHDACRAGDAAPFEHAGRGVARRAGYRGSGTADDPLRVEKR